MIQVCFRIQDISHDRAEESWATCLLDQNDGEGNTRPQAPATQPPDLTLCVCSGGLGVEVPFWRHSCNPPLQLLHFQRLSVLYICTQDCDIASSHMKSLLLPRGYKCPGALFLIHIHLYIRPSVLWNDGQGSHAILKPEAHLQEGRLIRHSSHKALCGLDLSSSHKGVSSGCTTPACFQE